MSENYKIPYASEHGSEKEVQSEEKGLGDYAQDALHSAAYSGIQSPISGVSQIFDKVVGTDLESSTKFLEAPDSTEAYSKEWHLQHISSAVGMVLPFMLARKGARRILAPGAHKALSAPGAEIGNVWKSNAVKEGALSGFIYESVFHPSHNSDNFIASRLKQGMVGAATFGSLTKFSIGARSLSGNLAKTSSVGSLLDNSIASTTLAGLPAGVINAQSYSLLFDGKLASGASTLESAYAMSMVGFALSAAHKVPVTEKLATPEPLLNRNNTASPAERLLTSLRTNPNGTREGSIFGERIQSTKEVVVGKAKQAATNLDAFLHDMANLGLPQGQLQMAMAGPTKGAFPVRMESLGHESQGSRQITESTTTGRGRNSNKTETTERRDQIVREEKVEISTDAPVKAGEFLRHHQLGEIADYVESVRGLRELRINPDPNRIFHGNDALIVAEVMPSAKYPNGAMLKAIVPEGGWEASWGKRPGDAKILGKVHEIDMGNSSSHGSSYLYLQEIVSVRERYETHLLDEYFRGIEKEKLSFEEPGNNPNKQFGISQETGKLVLIDYPSTGKPGHMQSLTEIIQGPEYYEQMYERENAQRLNGKEKTEAEQLVEAEGFGREANRQEVKEKRQLNETQRDMLEQLTSGVKPHEVAEYLAITRGHFTKEGQVDVSRVQSEIDAMLRIAKEEGLNLD